MHLRVLTCRYAAAVAWLAALQSENSQATSRWGYAIGETAMPTSLFLSPILFLCSGASATTTIGLYYLLRMYQAHRARQIKPILLVASLS